MKDPFVLIMASAGSGKTYQLTHHFAQVVFEALGADKGGSAERILAATFTRAAAREIVDRILMLLANAVREDDSRRKLAESIGASTLTEKQAADLLLAVVGRLHRLRVGTLDSFMVRSARTFAAELGLPETWSIADEAQRAVLCEEAADAMLRSAAREAESFTRMVDQLASLSGRGQIVEVRSALARRMGEGHSYLRSGPASAWERICPNASELLSDDQLHKIGTGLLARLNRHIPRTTQGEPNKNWTKALVGISSNIELQDWESMMDGVLMKVVAAGQGTFSTHPVPAQVIRELAPLARHIRAHFVSELHRRNIAMRELLTKFDAEYRPIKSHRGIFGFDDFPRMLQEAGVAGQFEEFCFRLDGRIDHILLDEFQDTSIAQWRFLEPLVAEIVSGGEGRSALGRTFFCVGDVKQTLYSWREAEPRLLGQLRDKWKHLAGRMLTESRRSSQVIIDTVNQVFDPLNSNAALNRDTVMPVAVAAWRKEFTPHTTARAGAPGYAVLRTCAWAEKSPDRERNALSLAADRVEAIFKADPKATIAVLVRRNRLIGRMLFELQKRGIAAAGEGGNPLSDDPAVCAALSLLHLIDHPDDSAARHHVLTSPLSSLLCPADAQGKPDLLAATDALRRRLADRGLAAVLNEWLGIAAGGTGARNFLRFSQLVESAHGFDYGGESLAAFIARVRTKRVESAAPERVSVMTVHSAKGRQFDYVILPDLDRGFLQRMDGLVARRPNVLGEADYITHVPTTAVALLDGARAIRDFCTRRRIFEELCVLYVSMTRSITGLEMIVHPSNPEKETLGLSPASHAGILREAFGVDPSRASAVLWKHKRSVEPGATAKLAASTPAETLFAGAPLKVRVAPGASRTRPVLAPSSMEGAGTVNLLATLELGDQTARDRGTAFHKFFELIEWLDEGAPSEKAMRDAAVELGLNPDRAEALARQFSQLTAAPNLRRLLSRQSLALQPGSAAEVWRERPFLTPEPERAAIIGGQFDRVVIVKQNGKVTSARLIDFKTDRINADPAKLEEKVEFYSPQIAAYRQALARLTGLNVDSITAHLAFTDGDFIVEVGQSNPI